MHLYVYTEEPIDFSIRQGNREEALKAISKVYSQEPRDKQIKFYDMKLAQHLEAQENAGEDTLWHALTDPNMRVSSYVSLVTALFNNLTGIGIIGIYSTAIFETISRSGATSRLTIKQDNTYIGYAGVVGALISLWTVSYFSRRAIFVGGHFFMGIFLLLSGYFIDAKKSEFTLLNVCLFIIAFNATQGTAFWIYAAEIVSSDAVMGLCMFQCMLCLITESMTCSFIMNSKIGVNGLFYILGCVQVVAFLILNVILKETKGLTQTEKK